ncbi:MAG: methyltransferase [Candidatus Woesearchaeota archaeon]
MKFFAIINEGTEGFFYDDLKRISKNLELSYKILFNSDGIILFEFDDISKSNIHNKDNLDNKEIDKLHFNNFEKNLIENISDIKFSDQVYLLLKRYKGISRYKSSLKNVKHQTAKISKGLFFKYMNYKLSYNLSKNKNLFELNSKSNSIEVEFEIPILVKATYTGRRDYKALDIERNVCEGLKKSLLKKFKDNKLCLKFSLANIFNKNQDKINYKVEVNYKLEVRSYISENISLLGLNVKNYFDFVFTKGSLNKGLAEVLLEIAELNKEDFVIDPMCGTGIIPILVSMRGIKTIGNDIDNEKIILAEKNKKLHSIEKNLEFFNQNALNLSFDNHIFSKVISNLPYDKEAFFYESKEDFEKNRFTIEKNQSNFNDVNYFLKRFFSEMIRITKNNAVFVFLSRYDLTEVVNIYFKEILHIDKVYNIKNAGLSLKIFKLRKIA